MIPVSEIFGPTVQGEGLLIGHPTVFVRTGGCDYRCAWCDTLYAVLPEHRHDWRRMSAEAIMARVEELSGGRPIMITLSGGNPAMHDLEPLIALGQAKGYNFAMETQGSLARPWFARLDHLILSPKPPSSGMETDWDSLAACAVAGPRTMLKVVIFDDADFAYAREAAAHLPHLPVCLQVGNPDSKDDADPAALMARFRWLVGKVVDSGWHEARVLPQLHVLAWGNERGV